MMHRPIFVIALLAWSLGGCASSSVNHSQTAAQQTGTQRTAARQAATQKTVPAVKKPKKAVSPNRLFAQALPFKIEASYDALSRQISPDGRYMASFVRPKGNRQHLILYNFATSKISTFDVGRLKKEDSDVELYLAWRQDSQACAVVVPSGLAILRPTNKKIRWISRKAPSFDSCLAWAPRSHRLAIFKGDFSSGSYFRVWNGRRMVSRLDWLKPVREDRGRGETSAMQAEWSPDEQSIALRYEGRSGISGFFDNPMDMVVLDAKTGRNRWYIWKNRAGPVSWLDSSRLIFQEYEDGYIPKSLIVARPKTKQHGEWLGNVGVWMLSAQHDTLWATTDGGYLYKTSTQKRQWTLVKRLWTPEQDIAGIDVSVSHEGDRVAFDHSAVHSLQLYLTVFALANRQEWQWQGSKEKVELLFMGWAKGRKFPLFASRSNVEPNVGGPWQVLQLRASK